MQEMLRVIFFEKLLKIIFNKRKEGLYPKNRFITRKRFFCSIIENQFQ